MKKIKVAFVKFCGMANGGTEKYLQTISALLPKSRFEVDFFYCDTAPYIGSDFKHSDTDVSRVEYTRSHGVNLIKFNVGAKNVLHPEHTWINTDFWQVFDPSKYDIIQTGRAGHPEYPFTLINDTPIVDSIHLAGMAENKENVKMTVLVSSEQREKWVSAGGDRNKSVVVSVPVIVPEVRKKCYRQELGLTNKFVFGMHQRDDDGIFSPIPLEAFSKIENDKNFFLLLGGSKKYQQQADELGLRNVAFLETTSDVNKIHQFLKTLDVYAHGRNDGEQCSSAIIEAMSHGLPLISHEAPSMGQKEQIGDAGEVVCDSTNYFQVMLRMMKDNEYYSRCSKNSLFRYENIYDVDSIINQYIKIYESIIK